MLPIGGWGEYAGRVSVVWYMITSVIDFSLVLIKMRGFKGEVDALQERIGAAKAAATAQGTSAGPPPKEGKRGGIGGVGERADLERKLGAAKTKHWLCYFELAKFFCDFLSAVSLVWELDESHPGLSAAGGLGSSLCATFLTVQNLYLKS